MRFRIPQLIQKHQIIWISAPGHKRPRWCRPACVKQEVTLPQQLQQQQQRLASPAPAPTVCINHLIRETNLICLQCVQSHHVWPADALRCQLLEWAPLCRESLHRVLGNMNEWACVCVCGSPGAELTLLLSSPPLWCSGVLRSDDGLAFSLLLLESLSLMMSYCRQNSAITAGRERERGGGIQTWGGKCHSHTCHHFLSPSTLKGHVDNGIPLPREREADGRGFIWEPGKTATLRRAPFLTFFNPPDAAPLAHSLTAG